MIKLFVMEDDDTSEALASWALPVQGMLRRAGYVGLMGHVGWVGEEVYYAVRRALALMRGSHLLPRHEPSRP